MEKQISLFQEIFNMQMKKKEEVPCLILPGCHCNYLIPTGSCQMFFSQLGLTSSYTSLMLIPVY